MKARKADTKREAKRRRAEQRAERKRKSDAARAAMLASYRS